jgi:hypothetical protein
MKNNKDDLYNTLVPSLKDRFFQQQLNFEEEQQQEENKPSKTYFKYAAYAVSLVLATGVFSYLAYTSYKYSAKPDSIESIPLVKRDITPIRTIPTDPGGEKFSNQDKLIYNNMLDSSAEKTEAMDNSPKEKIAEVKEEPEPIKAIKKAPEPKVEKESEPKKIPTPIKTKVAKKPKKLDNPFDILDNEVSALDDNKLKN